MSIEIYLDKESPDFNYGLWGRIERLCANRCILCLMTEFGLMNNKRMGAQEINKLIEKLQPINILKL